MKILFVCTGNTCRSPMAEHLLKKILFDQGINYVQVSSAGTAPAHHLKFPWEAADALKAEGVGPVQHSPSGINPQKIQEVDLVLTMDLNHQKILEENFPEFKNKIHLLKNYVGIKEGNPGIKDPFGQPLAVYQKTLSEIKSALIVLVAQLKNQK